MCVVRATRHHPSADSFLSLLQIRIEGYKAIVQMSEEQPRWLERNVDVLVQLLQSGAFPLGQFYVPGGELRLNVVGGFPLFSFFLLQTNRRRSWWSRRRLYSTSSSTPRSPSASSATRSCPRTTPWKTKTKPSASASARSSSRSSPRTPGSPSSRSCRAKGAVLQSRKMR